MKYLRLITLPAAGRHLMRTSSLTRHFLVGFLSVLITLVAAPVSVQAASVTVPPGLAPGSSYRLIFVTSGTRDAQSTNIADYNAFVAAQAAGIPALAALGTTWTAVVSTTSPTVAARDNTGTNPAAIGVPFYGLNGLRLAADNADLWDGTFIAPGTPLENAITDSNGNASAAQVWTGTQWEGTGPFGPLGANGAGVGHANSTSNWIANGSFGHNFAELNAMYAMSGVLVVPDYLVTTTGNAIVVTDLSGNGDTLTVSEPSAGNIKFAAAGRLFSINGGAAISGDSGDLSRASVASITVNAAAGADIINVGTFTGTLPSLTINGGTGNDSVNFNGDITFAADASLDADLFNDDASPGTDSVVVAAGANLIVSDAGTVTLKGNSAVSMAAGASVESVNGAISLTSLASGISVTGATITTTGTGNVTLTGTGVGDGGGISISAGSVISSTGTGLAANQGLLTLLGSGSGFGTGLTLTGPSSITSIDGAISITGFGNAGASNRTSKGIVVDSSTVQSTGTATITLTGKGNSATFSSDTNAQHHGIEVTGATALITSSAGKITLDGDARFGRSSNNFGVVVQNGAGVTGTGATGVELIGITRIASGLGSNGNGIVITDAGSRVTTVNGSLTLTGTGADQASSKGVVITTTGQVASTSGTITITGSYVGGGNSTGPGILYDSTTAVSTSGSINLVSGFGVGARMILSHGSISGTAGVTVKAGAGVPIDLGSTTDSASRADLSDAELDLITTSGTLQIGASDSGTITISDAITRSASTPMTLTSASNIVFNPGSIDTAGGALTLTKVGAGSVQPITTGMDATTSATTAVSFGVGSKLGIAIAGNVEDTDYSPLNVAGKVNLNGTTLALSGAYVPTISDSFVLVRNDGADAITGTFTGLAEGANLTVNGVSKQLTYVGGDGNDVLLVPPLPSVTAATTSLAANATTITINGNNFDTTPGNNTVVFNNGAVGTVTAATATSLTVIFSTQPTGPGSLTVVVTNGLGSSGAAVQVANVANIITTLTGGALTITDVANGNDTLSLSESAGNLVIGADASSVISSNAGTGSGTNSVSIPLSSITGLITANAAGGTDIINVGAFVTAVNGLTINGGTGNDTVNWNGDITFASGTNLDADLQNDDPTPGTDTVNFAAGTNLILSGTGTATIKCSGALNMFNAGASLVTANGDITIETNQQATQTVGDFYGVPLSNVLIESTGGGNISVKGRAGIGGTSTAGVAVDPGAIVRTNTGSITITGTGGTNSGGQNNGVQVHDGSIVESTGGGTIAITGNAGSQGMGIRVLFSGKVRTNGTGDITLTGVGGATTGPINYGVGIDLSTSGVSPAVTNSGSGTITINGTRGANTSGGALAPGFYTANGGSGTVRIGYDGTNAYSGNIVIIADSMSVANADIRTLGTATLRQKTNGTQINLGAADTAAVLGLTDAELDLITAGTLAIGDSNSGAITISGVISPANYQVLDIQKGVTFSATGGFTSDVTSATVFEKIKANGAVSINTSATLSLSGTYVPLATDSFTIINNTSATPITGTFAGLPEGANIVLGAVSMVVSYTGGDGNDVVLRRQAIIPVFLGASGSTGGGSGSGVIDAPNADATASLGKWESIRSGAVLSSNGRIAFRGFMELGTGAPPVTVNDFQGIWKYDGTDTRLKARSGSLAPDTNNALFDQLPLNPSISPDGLISFYGTLRMASGSPAVTASTNYGLWSEIGGGSARLLLRESDVIVGSKTFRGGFAVTTSSANTAALNAKLSSGTALLHLDVNTPSVLLTVVAEEGQTGPGGGTWIALDGNSSDPRLSANGDLGFIGWEKVGASQIQGIYSRLNSTAVGTAGAVVQARVGGTAPGTSGATFNAFERPTVFNGGMAFRGFLNLNGDNAGGTKGQGVWAGVFGALAPVVRTGDTNAQIPTVPAGRTVSSVWSPFSNALGSLTMRVSLVGAGETRAIMGSTGGTMRVIAKVGDTAPGLAGETFTNFDHPVIGDGDQVAFTAATNAGSYGIWKQAPGGGALSLVMKAGDTISTSEGDKVVSQISLPGATTDDRKFESRCMDALGRLLIHVTFSDGSTSLLLGQ